MKRREAAETEMPQLAWISEAASLTGAAGSSPAYPGAALRSAAASLARELRTALAPGTVLGICADNSPGWLALDLATHASGHALVPLPAFFTRDQHLHAVRASAMRALACSDARFAADLGFDRKIGRAGTLQLFAGSLTPAPLQNAGAIQKITFTSGTTSTPKGVVLTRDQQLAIAHALAQPLGALGIRRHLCALPLAVLLENVAGAYTALALGAACICPPLQDVGMAGATAFDPERLLAAIARERAESMIVLPEMLRALVAYLGGRAARDARLGTLRFVALGGAPTPAALIVRARELGLPVYEGYGLSECASVVTLNVPGADCVGSVGRPLPGVGVRVAADAELVVQGRAFGGYLDAPRAWSEFPTGDLGAIDGEGFVYILGRKKNVLVTAFGRNVSPEWPERVLVQEACIAHAVVFGDGLPSLVAVLAASDPGTTDAALAAAVLRANLQLPDYARIGTWVRAERPLDQTPGLVTPNGRIRREAVWKHYGLRLLAAQSGQQARSATTARQPS